MYYKNKENKPYFEPSQEIILRDGLEEITEEEFNQIVLDINTPTVEQVLEQKIAEAQAYLNSTDWYYARKAETGEEISVEVVAKRVEAREFIRNNK